MVVVVATVAGSDGDVILLVTRLLKVAAADVADTDLLFGEIIPPFAPAPPAAAAPDDDHQPPLDAPFAQTRLAQRPFSSLSLIILAPCLTEPRYNKPVYYTPLTLPTNREM